MDDRCKYCGGGYSEFQANCCKYYICKDCLPNCKPKITDYTLGRLIANLETGNVIDDKTRNRILEENRESQRRKCTKCKLDLKLNEIRDDWEPY